jgi:hypothetical protein
MLFSFSSTVLIISSSTASAQTSGDFSYETRSEIIGYLDWEPVEAETGVEITEYHGPGGDVVIPDSIDGVPVTSIGQDAFYFCGTLTSVTIPDSVTAIGIRAFGFCGSLTSVTIGNGVAAIQDEAFEGCFSLSTVRLGDATDTIGMRAFGYCYVLSSLTVPQNVTSIGEMAFAYCFGLNTVTFNGNAPSVGADWTYQRNVIPGTPGLIVNYYHGATGFAPSWNGAATVCLLRAPAAPDLMISSHRDQYAVLTWNVPDDGGSPIDRYTAYQNGIAVATTIANAANITGLGNNQTYMFTVSAHNSLGDGPNSTEVFVTPGKQLMVEKTSPINETPGAVGSSESIIVATSLVAALTAMGAVMCFVGRRKESA